jgi:crotonobetainyl-CoA:carnitine CoA-transferase CaiB-like acyl-CoA transferase
VNDVFECADGRRLTLGILEEHFWENFRRCVPGFESEDFSTDAKRRAHGDSLSGLLAKALQGKTSAEWIALFEKNDIPYDLCVTPGEAAAENPQLRERKATSGGFALFPVWADGRRGGELRCGVPRLGQHTREILVELGFDDAEIAGYLRDGILVHA